MSRATSASSAFLRRARLRRGSPPAMRGAPSSPRWRRAIVVVMAIGSLAVLGPAHTWAAQPSWGSRLVVDDDGAQCANAGFSSIQAAVDQAIAYDVIKVCAGRYTEQAAITVNKPLKIEGDGAWVMRTDTDGDAESIDADDCFSPTRPTFDPTVHVIVAPRVDAPSGVPTVLFDLQADNIELEGFVLEGNDNIALPGSRAAVQTSAAHSGYEIHHNFFVANTVATFLRSNGQRPSSYHDNCIRESGWGIANAGLGLIDARVHNNSSFRTRFFAYEQTRCNTCPALIGMADVTFDHNVSVNDQEGFRFAFSTNTTASQNSITSALFGAHLFGGTQGLRFIENYVEGRRGGLRRHSDPPTPPNVGALIQGNHITQAYPVVIATSVAAIGIGVGGLVNSQILDNVITGMERADGIALLAGNTGNVISRNDIRSNGGNGISVALGSGGNTFESNVMLGNGIFDPLTYVDARDGSRAANGWHGNVCGSDDPAGTICGVQ